MGCSGCGTEESSDKRLDENGMPRGCRNNGTCSSGGCDKLGVFDWLANMQMPTGKSRFDIVEIRFKNSRKSFFRNIKDYDLNVGDVVVVEASPGYDVGVISATDELSRIQLNKKEPHFKKHEARKVIRHATQQDIDKWVKARTREQETMFAAREMAIKLGLEMKISDVEYQGDGTKATFFYTANGRVDFRQLIKDMADTFKVRIEMRQIGARQEAARLGGIGSCGRELCCSTWLTDFRSVSTNAARFQQLSINPQKLAGQCGKLKCCLNFELDMYIEALKDFPSVDTKLFTKKGSAIHIKTDVFKGVMWYLYQTKEEGKAPALIAVTPERAKEIIALNKEKKNPDNLVDAEVFDYEPETPEYSKVVGQDDLSRFDDKFKKPKRRRKKKSNRPKNVKGAADKGAKTGDRKPGPAKAADKKDDQAKDQRPKGRRRPNRKSSNRPRGNQGKNNPRANKGDSNDQKNEKKD